MRSLLGAVCGGSLCIGHWRVFPSRPRCVLRGSPDSAPAMGGRRLQTGACPLSPCRGGDKQAAAMAAAGACLDGEDRGSGAPTATRRVGTGHSLAYGVWRGRWACIRSLARRARGSCGCAGSTAGAGGGGGADERTVGVTGCHVPWYPRRRVRRGLPEGGRGANTSRAVFSCGRFSSSPTIFTAGGKRSRTALRLEATGPNARPSVRNARRLPLDAQQVAPSLATPPPFLLWRHLAALWPPVQRGWRGCLLQRENNALSPVRLSPPRPPSQEAWRWASMTRSPPCSRHREEVLHGGAGGRGSRWGTGTLQTCRVPKLPSRQGRPRRRLARWSGCLRCSRSLVAWHRAGCWGGCG